MANGITRYEAPGIVLVKTESGESMKYDPDIVDAAFLVKKEYKPGDTIKIAVEMNQYASDDDKIIWSYHLKDIIGNEKFEYTFSKEDIGKHFRIGCKIVSAKEWHRYRNYDHDVTIYVNVVP